MEAAHLIQHWTDILMMKLVDVKLVIEVAISEHEVLPEVDVLAEKFGMLFATFIFNE